MIVFLQIRQYITIYMYLHALEICDVQFSITHVQPDSRRMSTNKRHNAILNRYTIVRFTWPIWYVHKIIVISYMSYLKKQYAPAKFWYME